MTVSVVPSAAKTAWSLRGTRPGRGGSRASCRARSSPRPGRPCPRTATGPRRSPATPADDETVPASPADGVRTAPDPGPTGRRIRNLTRCSRSVAQRPACVTRLVSAAAENDASVAAPRRAIPQRLPHLRGNDASPSEHGTRLLLGQHRTERSKAPSRPRSDAAPFKVPHLAGSPPQRGSALESRSLSQNKNPPWGRPLRLSVRQSVPIRVRAVPIARST